MSGSTPSSLKWLLVERATLAGDLVRLEAHQASLQASIEKTERRIQAMDRVLSLAYQQVNPEAAGTVLRHNPAYQGRGALRRVILETLQASPQGITAPSLAQVLQSRFSLVLITNQDRRRYIDNSVRPHLKRLKREGLVVSTSGAVGSMTLWQLKPTAPSFAELLAVYEKHGNGQAEHTSGHQVAHQSSRSIG